MARKNFFVISSIWAQRALCPYLTVASRRIFYYNRVRHTFPAAGRSRAFQKRGGIKLSAFSHCRKAEIHDTANNQVIPASVGHGVMDSLLITAPRDYTPPDPAQIVFYDPVKGLVTCKCRLTSPLVTDDRKHRSFRCEVLEQLAQDQRREDVKISTTVKVTVTLEAPDQTLEAPATIYNISAGGIYMVTNLDLQPGNQVFFYFHDAGGTIPLTAEVLRIETRPDRYSRPVKGYGCRFVDLAAMYELQLRGYVFKEAKQAYSD